MPRFLEKKNYHYDLGPYGLFLDIGLTKNPNLDSVNDTVKY